MVDLSNFISFYTANAALQQPAVAQIKNSMDINSAIINAFLGNKPSVTLPTQTLINPVLLKALHSGQLLAAVVTQGTAPNQSSGPAILSIHKQTVAVTSLLPLISGERLKLKVSQLSPRIELTIQKNIAQTSPHQRILPIIQQLVPKQLSLNPTFQLLNQVARSPTLLPANLQQIVNTIIKDIPKMATLSEPLMLRQAIAQSGIYLEARLAVTLQSTQTIATNDVKSSLLLLLSRINQRMTSLQTPLSRPLNEKAVKTPTALLTNPVLKKPLANTPTLQPTLSQPTADQSIAELRPAILPIPTPINPTYTPLKTTTQSTALFRHIVNTASGDLNTSENRLNSDTKPASNDSRIPVSSRTNVNNANTATTMSVLNKLLSKAADIPLPNAQTPSLPQSAVQSMDLSTLTKSQLLNFLKQFIEGAVARITLTQLTNSEVQNDGNLRTSIEIPVKMNDEIHFIHLNLERQANKKQTKDEEWTAHLSFNLPSLGALQIRIGGRGKTISARFWTESNRTLQLIESRKNELVDALKSNGIKVTGLNCSLGTPEDLCYSDTRNHQFLDLEA